MACEGLITLMGAGAEVLGADGGGGGAPGAASNASVRLNPRENFSGGSVMEDDALVTLVPLLDEFPTPISEGPAAFVVRAGGGSGSVGETISNVVRRWLIGGEASGGDSACEFLLLLLNPSGLVEGGWMGASGFLGRSERGRWICCFRASAALFAALLLLPLTHRTSFTTPRNRPCLCGSCDASSAAPWGGLSLENGGCSGRSAVGCVCCLNTD